MSLKAENDFLRALLETIQNNGNRGRADLLFENALLKIELSKRKANEDCEWEAFAKRWTKI